VVDVQSTTPASDISVTITTDDYALFVGKSSETYLTRFNKFGMEGNGHFRLTWHWPAFFFTFFWMIYRKLYGWALLVLVLHFLPFLNIFTFILWPITAHYIYYKHAKKNLVRIKRRHSSRQAQEAVIAADGGVLSPVAQLVGIVAILAVVGVLGAIAVPAYTDTVKRNRLRFVVHSMVSVKTAEVAARAREGRYVDCADTDEIRSRLGVTLDNRYIAMMKVRNGAITATVGNIIANFHNDVDGNMLTLAPDPTGSSWIWGGTVPTRYWLTTANTVLKEEKEE